MRISDAEFTVMEVLWREAPLTAAEIAKRIDPPQNWSFFTVKSLLSRLLGKGAVDHEKEGKRYFYRPLIARNECVARASRRLLDRMFEGRITPLVAHLVEHDQLSQDEIAEMEAFLASLKS